MLLEESAYRATPETATVRDHPPPRRLFSPLPATLRRGLGVLLGALFVAASVESQVHTFPGSGVGPIPDDENAFNCLGFAEALDITFEVGGVPGEIIDVELEIELEHSSMGELFVSLIAPDESMHIVFGTVGVTGGQLSCGDNSDLDGTYTFTDTALGDNLWTVAYALSDSGNVPSGEYRTTSVRPALIDFLQLTAMGPAFAGVSDANGTWTLRLADGHGGVDSGTGVVSSAELTLTTGQRTMITGTNLGPISDGGTCPTPGILRDVLFEVDSLTGPLLDVAVEADLSHEWIGDLNAALFAPDGTNAVLFARVGATSDSPGLDCVGDNADLDGEYRFGDLGGGENIWAAALDNSVVPPGTYRTTTPGSYPSPIAPETEINPTFQAVTELNGTWVLRLWDTTVALTGFVSDATLILSTSPSIFVDGFESGDVSAWSASAPSP